MLPDNMKTFLLAKAGSSENVLKISRELDKLIFEYQKMLNKE
jgi:hypothetical protein